MRFLPPLVFLAALSSFPALAAPGGEDAALRELVDRERFVEATRIASEILDRRWSREGPLHPRTILHLGAISELLSRGDDNLTAHELSSVALSLAPSSRPPLSPAEWARLEFLHAFQARRVGRKDETDQGYARALARLDSSQTEHPGLRADILQGMASRLRRQDPDESLRLYERALAERRRQPDPGFRLADNLVWSARALTMFAGRIDESERRLAEAETLLVSLGLGHHSLRASLYHERVSNRVRRGETEAADAVHDQALAFHRLGQSRVHAGVPRNHGEGARFSTGVRHLLQGDLERGWTELLAAYVETRGELLSRRRARQSAPDAYRTYRRTLRERDRRRETMRLLHDPLRDGCRRPPDAYLDLLPDWWRVYAQATAAREAMTAATPRPRLPSLGEFARSLAPDQAFLAWFDAPRDAGSSRAEPKRALAILVTPDGRILRHVPSPEELRRSDVAQRAAWTILEGAGHWPHRIDRDPELETRLRTVGAAWIDPFLERLEGCRELILCMPPTRFRLPAAALGLPGGDLVVDRFAVTRVDSPYTWWLAAQRSTPAPPSPRALVVGDPAYAETLPRLASSRVEAQRVADALPGSTVLLGSDASESRLRALAAGPLRDFGVLHLATHAVVLDRTPERSRLALARADAQGRTRVPDPSRLDDGQVTVEEIASTWELDAELVVLSGCRTGRGPSSPAGPKGLLTALELAGARGVVCSRWPVDDAVATAFVGHFYRELAGGTAPPQALRRAQRDLRDTRQPDGRQPYAHPIYWATFQFRRLAGS